MQIFWSGAKAGAPVVVRREGLGKPKDVRECNLRKSGNAIPDPFFLTFSKENLLEIEEDDF